MNGETRIITTATPPELGDTLQALSIRGHDIAQLLNGTAVNVLTADLNKLTAALTNNGHLVSTRLDFCGLRDMGALPTELPPPSGPPPTRRT